MDKGRGGRETDKIRKGERNRVREGVKERKREREREKEKEKERDRERERERERAPAASRYWSRAHVNWL